MYGRGRNDPLQGKRGNKAENENAGSVTQSRLLCNWELPENLITGIVRRCYCRYAK